MTVQARRSRARPRSEPRAYVSERAQRQRRHGRPGRSRGPMASQRDIRRRIGAVRNIKQITRAMQFVAASKLKRAQDATLAARPVQREARRGPRGPRGRARRRGPPAPRRAREGGKRLIVLVTTDRGLAGPAQHEHDPLRGARDHRAPGRPRGRDGRAQGPRRDAPRRRAAGGALRRASATGRRSPTSCRSPGSSPTTSWPARTAGSTSSTAASCRR